MSKAERRKRAKERQRIREQERAAAAATPGYAGGRMEPQTSAGVMAHPPPALVGTPEHLQPTPNTAYPVEGQAPRPLPEPPSPFITGPVAPTARRAAAPAAAPAARTAPSLHIDPRQLIDAPIDGDFEEGEDDEDEDEELTDGEPDDDDDDQEDDDGEEGDEDEDGDLDLEDTLHEVACGAIEQGGKLEWQELCAWLVATEIEDPRLALLVGLLCEGDTKLTGDRVIEVMEEMEMSDLVAEARVAVAEEQAGESEPEERQLVRTTSKEVAAQVEQKLGGKPASRDERKPVKSTQLRKPVAGAAALNVGLRGPQPTSRRPV